MKPPRDEYPVGSMPYGINAPRMKPPGMKAHRMKPPSKINMQILKYNTSPPYQAENEPVDGYDGALPDEVVERLDVLVDLVSPGRRGKLTDEILSEST